MIKSLKGHNGKARTKGEVEAEILWPLTRSNIRFAFF